VKWLAQGAEWLIKTLPFIADAMDYAARHLPDILSMAKSGAQKLFTGMERAIDEAVGMLYGLLARFIKGSADDAVQAAAGQGAKQTSSEVAEQAARQGGDAVDEIKVIGRLEDTAVAKDWAGHDVLNDPNWTLKRNDGWVQSGIDNKQDFYIASPTTKQNLISSNPLYPGETVFARELGILERAGYERVGDYMIAPR
jgi:hypothetical protein